MGPEELNVKPTAMQLSGAMQTSELSSDVETVTSNSARGSAASATSCCAEHPEDTEER